MRLPAIQFAEFFFVHVVLLTPQNADVLHSHVVQEKVLRIQSFNVTFFAVMSMNRFVAHLVNLSHVGLGLFTEISQ